MRSLLPATVFRKTWNARAFYEKMGGEVIGADLANEEAWQNSVTYRFAAA